MKSPAYAHTMSIQVGGPHARKTHDSFEFGPVQILQECSARACLIDIEPVNVALEVHYKPACLDDKHSNNQALP